ncbi:Lipoate-protein ligase A [Halalkaliarchaeum sp. AArc-CO]|uniref:lipoyl protein ligase domain-containing protein n=1 Tax=unclassified Halalkaliarchaeum TaxID=2678344 RepID=UPI00217F0CBD|nr:MULTISPECIES: lipoate--protein ligase family protein [unclassified Halalkaliarchaeum]MDR5671609.1 lipoate--protein ligase family protein [Halalkaliarchaeum sp. AArc-GB]UWG51111.1 Lipoate-protein ligase A [Halalkaliarchaeum sp. AArc-CO]
MAVHVVRGCPAGIEADRELAERLLEIAAERGEPWIRVWRPPRQLAFGRRDANEPGYDAAKAAARSRGFPPVERSVGGRAVAYDGTTTAAFAYAVPLSDPRRGLSTRYDWAIDRLQDALESTGANVRLGEPTGAFCPGDHSLRAVRDLNGSDHEGVETGGKIAGIAQRIGTASALVSGVVVIEDTAELRKVLAAVYDRLDLSFDPDALGSVKAAGGNDDPEAVVAEMESAFVDGRQSVVERIDR